MWARLFTGLVVVLALTCAGCTNEPDPAPSPTATTATTAPTSTSKPTLAAGTVELTGSSAQLRVGQRLYVAGYDTEEADLLKATSSTPQLLAKVDDRTFEAKAPGKVTLTIESYFHDCPDGPCARQNEPDEATVTITR